MSISAASAARARLLFYKLVLHAGKQSGSEPSDSASVTSLTQWQCIDLRTFLRFQLEQCKADPSAVMDQLRIMQTTVEWNKAGFDSAPVSLPIVASDLLPVKLTASGVLDDLKSVYSSTLTHLYPALSIVHNAPNPHLPADQLPNIVSMSTLPGITPPPATTITSPQLDYEDVVEKLMESQAHWSQHAAHQQQKEFLERFVLVDAEALQDERRQASRADKRQRANSERSERQSARATQAGKHIAFAATAPLSQNVGAVPAEVGSGNVDEASKEAAEGRSKQSHDRAGVADDEEKELRHRQLEQHIKAQHDDSEWQPHPGSETEEQKQPPSSSSPVLSPAPSPAPADTVTSEAYELGEPALCMSALLHRCLGEMGGGYAKRRVEEWREAVAAERAYAAACIKHHGYTERAMRYSSSIAIVELLRRALQPNSRTRCLSHPSLPQWFKSVVQATFKDVRSPLLTVLRKLDDDVAEDDSKEADTSADDVQSVAATATGSTNSSDTLGPSASFTQPASTAAELSAAASAAAQLVRHAQNNLAALRLEYTSLTAQPPQQREQQPAATAASADTEMDSRMAAMLVNVSRTRQELEDANNHLRRNIALMDAVVMRQKAESADDKRTAKLRVERQRADRRMQVNLEASSLVSDCYKNAWFIVSGIDSAQLNVTTDMPARQRQLASDADEIALSHKDRLAVVRSSTGRRRHSLLSIQPSQHTDLKHLAADVLQQSQADLAHRDDEDEDEGGDEDEQSTSRNQTDSLDPAMMRSYSTRPRNAANQPSTSSTVTAASSLWSTWSISSATSRVFDSQPFDSSWINQLVHSKSTTQLADSLQPAIQRYHTVSRLRLRLVQLINSQFRSGKRAEIVAHAIPSLLPCLSRSKHGSHLLYNSGLLLREDESQRTLLSFYKHIVDALNNPTGGDSSSTTTVPLSFSSTSWPVLRQCLHLFNVDFLPEDAEAVVGSGIFASLSRWMTQIDKVLDKHRLHQLGSATTSSTTSNAASRAISRAHTRTSSLTHSGAAKAVTSCPAAYALKRLMWQTYLHLALFYLSQQQQHEQRQQQLDNQADLNSSTAALSTDLSKGDNVVNSSLSAMYSSALLSNLARLSRAPSRFHFHNDDGLLRETQEAAVMMLHLARLKQPALSPAQLARLATLVPFAPPTTQQSVVQLMGYELSKVSPRDFDQHLNDTAPSAALTSASPTIINSAAAFTSSLLGLLGDLIDKTSAISSLASVSSLFTSRPRRSALREQKEPTESKQAQWETAAVDLDEDTWRQSLRTWSGHSGKRERTGGITAEYPTFASPENVLSASASTSTYQEWRSGEEQQFNSANLAVLEELILVLRSLCQDRTWRRLLLPQLIQPVLALPSAVDTLRALQADKSPSLAFPPSSAFSSVSSLCQAVSAGGASLAVMGGWSFSLRRGAYVELNMQGDFAADAAAPATSSLLPAASAAIHRGFVQSVDFDARTSIVLTSTSQPRLPARLYRVDDSAASAGLAETTAVKFSFDQLRSIPAISAPNLNDQSTFSTVWSALAAVLTVSPHSASATPINDSLSASSIGVMQLAQAYIQRLAVGVVHSQAIMAVRSQPSTKLHIVTRSAQRSTFEDSLPGPVSPSFDLLASPTFEPLTLSPPPSAAYEGSDNTPTSLTSFSLANSTDDQSDVTWTLQPMHTSSILSSPSLSKPSRLSSMLSRRSPVASPEPRPARTPVDYSVFVGSVMQLAKSASHNFLFSLTPFAVDAAMRQMLHRLSSVLSLDVQRRRRLSCLATCLSRLASRATSRAITRSASLHASGTVTPASHDEDKQQVEQQADTVSPLASLPMFPQHSSAVSSSRRPLFIADEHEIDASSVQSTPRETALADWSAVTSQSPSPSSLPHFIQDTSDPLHTPIWSPSPRLDRILHRLQAQLPHLSSTSEQQQQQHEEENQQSTEDEHSEPTSPTDNEDTREMHVHDEDDEPVDHTDTMFIPHDRQPNIQQQQQQQLTNLNDDADYTDDLFDDEQLDTILDPPPLLRSPADLPTAQLPSSPFNHIIFHYLYGLVSIGYPDHCARFALARCGGNLHAALEFLLSGEITLFDEYRQVGAAMMAFQHLLYRLGVIERDDSTGQVPDATAIDSSAPVVYRHIPIAQHNDRELLLSAIQHLAEQQSNDLFSLAVYDWVDARDSYGKRFLAQIVRKTVNPPSVTVHFLAWQDQFNETIALPSDRLQLVTPALIEQTRLRLESDRQLSRVKVYGPPVHRWITTEKAKLAAPSAEQQGWQPSSIHMADPYSFPVTRPPARADPLTQPTAASSELLGARVYVTPECITMLHTSLCLPALDVASEYVKGNKLLVVDTVGKLCEAEITEVRGAEIRIHYPGWGGKWDETLSVHSPRIQGRQGSNKRRVREGNVMPGSDSAKQLYELVGSTGIIVEVTKGCKLEGAERTRGRAADKADDALVRVELLDEHYGTVVTFRTRLALLKRVEAGDAPQLSQSALLAMSRSQLLQTNRQSEESALAALSGQLLQTLTRLTLPRPATDLRTVKLRQLLDALAITNRLSVPLYESARHGWSDSVYGQVGESCVVVSARHVQPWTQSEEQDAPAPPEGTELTLDSHPHTLVFRSLEPPDQQKGAYRQCNVCHQPRCNSLFACGQCEHIQCLPCTVHALPFAHLPPPSNLSAQTEAKDDEKRVTEGDRAAHWIDTTAYRPPGRSGDKEKLQLLDALTQQLLEVMPDSGDMQLRGISPATLTMLNSETEEVVRSILAMSSYSEQQASEVRNEDEGTSTSLTSPLNETALAELRAGQRVRLHVDRLDIDSLLVAWTRSSQPNFDLHFYQCAPDSSTTLRPTGPLAPLVIAPPSSNTTASASNQQQVGQASEESIQPTEDNSRSTSTSAATNATSLTPNSSRPQSQACQLVDALPPALMCLRALPPLKSAGVPLLVPNPCYVSIGGVKRSADEIADAADDELQISVTPVKRTSLDGIALWAELMMHVRREWMLSVAHASSESIRHEVLRQLRDSHRQLCATLFSILDALLNCLIALHSKSPWPSSFGARSVELAAHLFLVATEVLKLPSSHPLFGASDSVRVEKEQLARWKASIQAVTAQSYLRTMNEHPAVPLYSAYLHRLNEFVSGSSLYIETLSERSHYERALQQLHGDAQQHPHELTRALLRTPPERADHPKHTILVPLSAHSLYEQSSHTTDCPCQYCQHVADKMYRSEVLRVDFNSPFWALAMGCSPLALPPAARFALLDDIINATANPDKTQPEFILHTSKDAALEAAALSSSSVAAHSSADDSTSVMRQLFLQLSNTSPTHFLHKLGEISFKALFKGPFHRGAQGTPGPFRQVLTDVCADLRRSTPTSLFIPCPNFTHDTGLNRNQLILNPASGVKRSDAEALGRLMGIALRSGGVLDLDIAGVVWKQLVGQHVDERELAEFDFTAYHTLRFKDYTNPDDDMSEEEWNDNYGQLTWTTLASDGVTRLQMRAPSTSRPYVLYSERKLYAKSVIQARFSESVHLLDCIKAGLYSILPRAALSILRWTELRHRVCGDSEVDLDALAAHTVYAPKKFTSDTPIVQWLWNTLRSFSSDERGKFLQFCLARSRLPPTTSREGSWRMKVNVLEAANQRDLPTAETWSASHTHQQSSTYRATVHAHRCSLCWKQSHSHFLSCSCTSVRWM